MYMFSIILCYNTLFVAHRIIRLGHRQLSNSESERRTSSRPDSREVL